PKEATRSNPERLAIRTKLLEVYAKRRYTKGFELLATQLFALTRGEGEDWSKAQELGQQIDPDNPLYKPGGAPLVGEGAPVTEPLGASTMPQSVLPTPSQFERSNAEIARAAAAPPPLDAVDSGSVDLDLDLDLDTPAGPISAPAQLQTTQPLQREPERATLDFGGVPELPPMAPAASAAGPASDFPMDFDLSAISL